jgi:hypothetical protein
MPGDAGEPLPAEIALTRTEAANVLFALDAAMEALPASGPVQSQLHEAARIIVEKFLPDLPNL